MEGNISLRAGWYATYQEDNKEKFNEDFIYSKASSENMEEILANIAKSLESTGHVKFLSCKIEADESKFQDIHMIEESRLVEASIGLKLFCNDPTEGYQEEDIVVKLLLPKLINNFYYQLNGNKYFAIYQMIDRGTYSVGSSIGLKTMLMPFTIRAKDVVCVDTKDVNHNFRLMELDVFRKVINIILYFISEAGIDETFKFFDAYDYVKFVNSEEEEEEGFTYFAFEDLKLKVENNWLSLDKWFVGTLLSLLVKSKISSSEEITSHEYWQLILGKQYTANKDQAIKKAKMIHKSIRRILDGNTKNNMVHILEKDKKTIYHLFRWILYFYDDLIREDNMDLKAKRLRLNEWILYPFINKLSNETYRCFNSRKTSMKLIKTMFSNIKPNLCIRQLVTNELLRFVNSVNGIDLFSAGLKITQAGPQGLNNSDNVPMRYRGIHESYIGNIGLTAASAGEPGITATLTPFVKLDGLFFDKTVEHVTPDHFKETFDIIFED